MARKIKNILKSQNVREFMRTLQYSCTCTEEQARQILTKEEFKAIRSMGYLKREHVRVSQDQAKILYENGVISKEKYEAECKYKVQVVTVFKRTEKGTKFADKHHNAKKNYSSGSYIHDICLTAKQLQLKNDFKEGDKELKFQQESINREKLDARIEYMRKNKPDEFRALQEKYEAKCEGFIEKMESDEEYRRGSAPDLAYRRGDGKWVAFEVTTCNYSHFKCCLKEFSAEILGYEYETLAI